MLHRLPERTPSVRMKPSASFSMWASGGTRASSLGSARRIVPAPEPGGAPDSVSSPGVEVDSGAPHPDGRPTNTHTLTRTSVVMIQRPRNLGPLFRSERAGRHNERVMASPSGNPGWNTPIIRAQRFASMRYDGKSWGNGTRRYSDAAASTGVPHALSSRSFHRAAIQATMPSGRVLAFKYQRKPGR